MSHDPEDCVDASNQRPVLADTVMSVEELKTNFLFGVDLRDDDGNEMPDSLFERYIKSATEWLQRELEILILPTTIENERHDYNFLDYTNFGLVNLHHFPVRKLCKYTIQFPISSSVLDFDPSWFKIDSVGGTANLIPTQGTLSSILIGQGGAFLPLLYSGRDYIPYVISLDYEAGFEEGKIPADILEVIGMKAAMGPLNIAGDLVVGAGIASKSLSIDALSQSIGSTSSATNAGFGARILTYSKQIKEMTSLLRRNYKGIKMVVA